MPFTASPGVLRHTRYAVAPHLLPGRTGFPVAAGTKRVLPLRLPHLACCPHFSTPLRLFGCAFLCTNGTAACCVALLSSTRPHHHPISTANMGRFGCTGSRATTGLFAYSYAVTLCGSAVTARANLWTRLTHSQPHTPPHRTTHHTTYPRPVPACCRARGSDGFDYHTTHYYYVRRRHCGHFNRYWAVSCTFVTRLPLIGCYVPTI